MKNISIFLKHVVTPSLFCIFIIIGLTAAAISGIIECIVIREFLSGVDFIGSLYIPVIIVVILEGLKLFLHYAIPAHEKNDDYQKDSISETNSARRKLLVKKITKYTLVLFSLLCTVIYTSTAMYKPQVVSEETASRTIEIQSELQQKLEQDILKAEEDSRAMILKAENEVNSITEEIKKLKPVYRPQSAYTRYITEKKRLEGELSTAQGEYLDEFKKIIKERDKKINEIKDEYELQMENKDLNAEKESSYAGDNAYLSSALLFISSLFGAKSYSRGFYYICVLLISIIVSVILELAIAFSQDYLSLNSDKLDQLFGSPDDSPGNEAIKSKATMTVRIIVQAAIMLSICLIYAAFTETIITDKGIFFAFLSYFASIILTSKKYIMSSNNAKSCNEEPKNKVVASVAHAKGYILPIIVQTLICIVGFLVLSRSLDSTATNSMVTTIALSVGSVSGQIILKSNEALVSYA